MILYTIVPEHFIYPIDEAVYTKQKIVDFNGVQMVVENGPNGESQVIRVISSDPAHFLQYEPGQRLWIH
ncbi:MAG: YlzJ-like family protein [Ectobacillus sp.]